MKKVILTSAILAFAASSAVYANGGTYMEPASMGHFYVGIGIDRDVSNAELNEVTTSDGVATSTSTDFGLDGISGRLFAGYGMVFQDRYYLGLEIFGGLSSADGNRSISVSTTTGTFIANLNTEIEHDGTYGVRLMPGIKLSDSTMGYLNIGYIRGRWEIKETGTLSTGLTGVVTNQKEWENGIQLGLGMETMIAQNVSLRLGWNWNRYSSVDFATLTGTIDGVAASETSSLNHPTNDEFYLDAIYHFV